MRGVGRGREGLGGVGRGWEGLGGVGRLDGLGWVLKGLVRVWVRVGFGFGVGVDFCPLTWERG